MSSAVIFSYSFISFTSSFVVDWHSICSYKHVHVHRTCVSTFQTSECFVSAPAELHTHLLHRKTYKNLFALIAGVAAATPNTTVHDKWCRLLVFISEISSFKSFCHILFMIRVLVQFRFCRHCWWDVRARNYVAKNKFGCRPNYVSDVIAIIVARS